MRWFVCAVAAYGAVRAIERKLPGWVWAFGGLAVVFNPILSIGFNRVGWAVMDAICAAVMLRSFASAKLNRA